MTFYADLPNIHRRETGLKHERRHNHVAERANPT